MKSFVPMLTALCLTSLVLAAFPALMFLGNLRAYRPPVGTGQGRSGVSVLIPARDEGKSIASAVGAALEAGAGVDLEVIVLDDHSRDDTAAIVSAVAASDARVRLVAAPELPGGWCGKQHACEALAALATKPVLVFVDADVRLAPGSLARITAFLDESGADLASGFPRQETVGVVEQMVIPLMHFVLLGFLPVRRMRARPDPRLAAGCGQLFVTRKSSYERMGGHAAIRSTLHDGLKLPRAYRAAGLKTDLFDATGLAVCRMYRGGSELWSGLAKNATEALAAPALIAPATLVLFGGQVVPLVLVLCGPTVGISTTGRALAWMALAFSYLPRFVAVVRFRQPVLGAILHPVGVLILLAIQWSALVRDLVGRPATWKGRPYPSRA